MPSRMTCPAATPPSCVWHFTALQMWEAARWLRPSPARFLASWSLGECDPCLSCFCFLCYVMLWVTRQTLCIPCLHWLHLTAGNSSMLHCSDTMDSVKQSAALCLLRLYKTSPDLVLMGEWTSRVVHLLNDQHMVRAQFRQQSCSYMVRAVLRHWLAGRSRWAPKRKKKWFSINFTVHSATPDTRRITGTFCRGTLYYRLMFTDVL